MEKEGQKQPKGEEVSFLEEEEKKKRFEEYLRREEEVRRKKEEIENAFKKEGFKLSGSWHEWLEWGENERGRIRAQNFLSPDDKNYPPSGRSSPQCEISLCRGNIGEYPTGLHTESGGDYASGTQKEVISRWETTAIFAGRNKSGEMEEFINLVNKIVEKLNQ